jgi:integrase
MDRIGFCAGADLKNATARAFHAFLFSCETAMRAGEVIGLTWDRIDLERRVAHLAHTKNGRPRDVPLSLEAVRLLEALPDLDPVFGLSSRQLDILFRKSRDKAGVADLTYHDSRHYAITRLSRKLDVLDLARMVGHTDLRMLMTYYNESAESIARRLD